MKQFVEHRLHTAKGPAVLIGGFGDGLQVLGQASEPALDLEEPLGLRERVAVCQASPDQFARNACGRSRDAPGTRRQLIDVRLSETDRQGPRRLRHGAYA